MQDLERENIDFKLKSSFVFRVFNENLANPIKPQSHARNVIAVRELVEKKLVPEQYQTIPTPEENYKFFYFDFMCLLWAYTKKRDVDNTNGIPSKNRKIRVITDELIQTYLDRTLLLGWVKSTLMNVDDEGNPLYKGKWFSFLFSLEDIRCHQNSFYTWSKLNPELPTYDRNKLYTAEEFEEWRKFMRNKPGRKPPQIKVG